MEKFCEDIAVEPENVRKTIFFSTVCRIYLLCHGEITTLLIVDLKDFMFSSSLQRMVRRVG